MAEPLPNNCWNLANLNTAVKLRCIETDTYTDRKSTLLRLVPYFGKLSVLDSERNGWSAALGTTKIINGENIEYTGRTAGEHYGDTTCTDGTFMEGKPYDFVGRVAVGPKFLFTYTNDNSTGTKKGQEAFINS